MKGSYSSGIIMRVRQSSGKMVLISVVIFVAISINVFVGIHAFVPRQMYDLSKSVSRPSISSTEATTLVSTKVMTTNSNAFIRYNKYSGSGKVRMSDTTAAAESGGATMSIEDVTAELRQLKQEFDTKLHECSTVAQAEEIRRDYLGKKGPIQKAMNYMRVLSVGDKPKLGVVLNEIKDEIEQSMTQRKEELMTEQINAALQNDRVDVTMPGTTRMADIGRRHPISMTMEKAVDIFVKLGYDTVTGSEASPEIETDYYCFTALNSPKDHPARDMQDTFYLTSDMEYLLRTHTSSVQIRQLERRKPPLRIVAPGRVYRKDDIDATHSLMFHQVEILALEERGELNIGHLKGTVEHFLKEMLGPDIQVRFRGSYFPFTEPSMEVDVYFKGRWLEVLGCGMVDPNVLEMAGIDSTKYSGFAAGFGVERFTMVIHQIADLRLFYNNDKRFVQQFPHFYDDGLMSFLKDGSVEEPKIDIRSTEIPDPPVNNMAELAARLEASRSSTKTETTDTTVTAHDIAIKDGPIEEKLQTESKSVKKSGTVESSSTNASENIDISKLDIRVGLITKVWEHSEADKLFCEEIDIGEEQPRSIASGLRQYYTVDQLLGKRVLVLANLKARKLMGFPSHGMVLCASTNKDNSNDGNTAVELIEPPEDAPIGDRIVVEGYTNGEPATENQLLKKKMLDVIFPDLRTNSDGVPTYRNIPLSSLKSGKPCQATSIPNGNVA